MKWVFLPFGRGWEIKAGISFLESLQGFDSVPENERVLEEGERAVKG